METSPCMNEDNEENNCLPEHDDSPDLLLTKRIRRAEADNAVWQEQYNLLYQDHLLVLEGADAILKTAGDPILLEEVYEIVKEKDERLAQLFRPLVDMLTQFEYNYNLVTGEYEYEQE